MASPKTVPADPRMLSSRRDDQPLQQAGYPWLYHGHPAQLRPYQRGFQNTLAQVSRGVATRIKAGDGGVSQSDGAELGAEYHAEDLNKINNKTNKDLKDSSSQLADATFDQQGRNCHQGLPIEPKAGDSEGCHQTPSGKAWGTGDDPMTAQWMFRRVQLITPTAIEPNWAQWANVIRLMRASWTSVATAISASCMTG